MRKCHEIIDDVKDLNQDLETSLNQALLLLCDNVNPSSYDEKQKLLEKIERIVCMISDEINMCRETLYLSYDYKQN